jgi:hypothetical protein
MTEVMTVHTCDCLAMHTFCPLPPVILSASTYSSCWYPEDSWRWAECLLCLFPQPCNKPPFSTFNKPLYLAFRGGWLDLAHGLSGVWTFGPKFQFHHPLVRAFHLLLMGQPKGKHWSGIGFCQSTAKLSLRHTMPWKPQESTVKHSFMCYLRDACSESSQIEKRL